MLDAAQSLFKGEMGREELKNMPYKELIKMIEIRRKKIDKEKKHLMLDQLQ